MRVGQIGAVKLQEDAYRLNGGFFLSEDEHAMRVLRRWSGPSSALHELTVPGGVFSGPIFRKISASGPDHGMGYVSAKDILKTDICPNGYLSYKHGPLLDQFRLRQGTILLTCSGMNLGRSIWVRTDMEGLAGSGDLIRIVPDERAVAPGYLFAFVSSRYGRISVRRLIYGGHIKHVSPTDVGRIQAPRLGDAIEHKTDGLIREAATLRTQATATLGDVAHRFDALVADVNLRQTSPRVDSVNASGIQARFDAQFHDPVARCIRDHIKASPHATIRQWCTRIFLPGIFKRIHVEDAKYGAPYFTGASLFWLEPHQKGILSKKTSLFEQVKLEAGTVLVQAFGQEGGLTGRSVWVGEHLHNTTTTHMLVRLNTDSVERSAYLFGFLQSDAAYRQIACLPYGGSIPHFDEAGIASVMMPLLDEQSTIEDLVLGAVRARDRALSAEREARRIVEQAIEEAS